MHLYKLAHGALLVDGGNCFLIKSQWDELINRRGLHAHLRTYQEPANETDATTLLSTLKAQAAPPIGQQEVWAAGVTYKRSRDARMEEAQTGGGSDFYQKVYEASRPELFFKALPHRISGHGGKINIRNDSSWNVPEPELTLFINTWGDIEAFTIGNDVSSRSIEGENPLYLPQAKTYEKSTGLGPCLYVPADQLPSSTSITLQIYTDHHLVFEGSILLSAMKRSFPELVSWLFRACHFPFGCFLMTGTGIVPPDQFTLSKGDRVVVSIDGIGVLKNEADLLDVRGHW